jgi:hypothetical protein
VQPATCRLTRQVGNAPILLDNAALDVAFATFGAHAVPFRRAFCWSEICVSSISRSFSKGDLDGVHLDLSRECRE